MGELPRPLTRPVWLPDNTPPAPPAATGAAPGPPPSPPFASPSLLGCHGSPSVEKRRCCCRTCALETVGGGSRFCQRHTTPEMPPGPRFAPPFQTSSSCAGLPCDNSAFRASVMGAPHESSQGLMMGIVEDVQRLAPFRDQISGLRTRARRHLSTAPVGCQLPDASGKQYMRHMRPQHETAAATSTLWRIIWLRRQGDPGQVGSAPRSGFARESSGLDVPYARVCRRRSGSVGVGELSRTARRGGF